MTSVALLEAGEKDTQAPQLWCGCVDCARLLDWRSSSGSRTVYKALSTFAFFALVAVYCYVRRGFPVLVAIATLWCLKNVYAAWGQDTPTWIVPGNPLMFCVVYCVGIPSVMWMLAGCPQNGEIVFQYRDVVGLVLFVIGSGYSLAYEAGRFQWKKLPENKGHCHTVGLATLSIHPNYFGDLISYTGWAIAGGTFCALSISLFQAGMFLWFVIPNSDAYLAQRYSADFPGYAAKTAPLIPFVVSPLLNQIIAWVGFAGAVYTGTYCAGNCSQ